MRISKTVTTIFLAGVVASAAVQGRAGAASGPTSAPNDALFAEQWGLTKIQAPDAWSVADGTGVTVAVLDTGVDLTHPDLKGKLVVFKDADFVDPKGKDGPQDEHYHGTHVAGIVGASTDNGFGVAGTAPGAKILPVRVLDAAGSGSSDWIAAGIRYATKKKVDVINMSLGMSPLSGPVAEINEALADASSKGIVSIIAAGNSYFPLCSEPAAAPNVVCVGATAPEDTKSGFSNFDATMMKNYLVAPGGEGRCDAGIVSTWLVGAKTSPNCSNDPAYGAAAGTSMAAPFVAGVAALLADTGLRGDEIIDRLIKTADDIGLPGRDPLYGFGRVNALRAVEGG